jgi:hypothetical protein
MRHQWIGAAVAAAVLFLGSCSSGDHSGQAAGARPSSTATLAIVEPQPGAVIQGSEVGVKLELNGGRITSQVSTRLEPDLGHIHLKLDGTTVTLLGSLAEVIPDVSPGQHVLEAEFVAVDHGPFDPRVISTATFTSS